MESKDKPTDKIGATITMDKDALNNILYSNVVTIISHNEDDVEIGLCVRNPDGSAEVKQRLIFSISHFHRVADLFNKLSLQLKER
ncbi:hypothetical protein [Sphingobacterium kyonggiense]